MPFLDFQSIHACIHPPHFDLMNMKKRFNCNLFVVKALQREYNHAFVLPSISPCLLACVCICHILSL